MMKLAILGVGVHLLYLFSVFHIYFKSPIIHGISSVKTQFDAPAKRLVLMSADGLQAEKAFHHKYSELTPFFRSVIKETGSWGVSHTRVPTETRVGHVSIFAGTYEDVSAITNGWKNNPVEFDSVINQSSTTWYWGYNEVINIFNHHSKNIKAHDYGDDELNIDFADKDTTKFDKWVLDELEGYLKIAKQSKELNAQLHEEKIVFFLHLNGMDTVGHALKPDSKEALKNVEFVDSVIKNITKLFESFYENDGKTTYIVTSDHGMTPWGSHGAGDPLETETPFIGWGAGIKRSNHLNNVNGDAQSKIWWLEDYERRDMAQVDLAPLMSFLIGTPIPVNSVGRLPYQVLDVSEQLVAVGMLQNVQQIYRQYNAHEMKVRESSFVFTSYEDHHGFNGKQMISKIKNLISDGKFTNAVELCNDFISSALKGVHYYQHYDKSYLCLVVNVNFICWMVIILIKVLKQYTPLISVYPYSRGYRSVLRSKQFGVAYYCCAVFIAVLLWNRSKNFSFILFTIFPFITFKYLLDEITVLNFRTSINIRNSYHTFIIVIFLILGLEAIVYSFVKRKALFILGLFLSTLPWIKSLSKNGTSRSHTLPNILWSVAILFTCVFPLFPVVTRQENYFLVVLAGFIGMTICLIYSFTLMSSNIIAVLTGTMFITIVIKMHTVVEINHGDGLPLLNQIFSWSSLLILPAIGFCIASNSIERLIAMNMSLFSIYILTSISYEALFVLALIFSLTTWIYMEVTYAANDASKNEPTDATKQKFITTDHIRISFIFLYFIFLSFFGTGNIASVNSFDVTSLYCFLTVFNRTIQGIVIFIKAFIPFLIVTISFRSIHSMLNIPTRALFLVVLLMTDFMAVNFFFLIKDEGSWLDIGQSVSHFIITLVFTVFLVPIYEISNFISGNVCLKISKMHSN